MNLHYNKWLTIYLQTILKESPAVLFATGTVKNSLPQLCTGGKCSTMWSPMYSVPTDVHTAPENTDKGLSDWTRVPDRSSGLCICESDVKIVGILIYILYAHACMRMRTCHFHGNWVNEVLKMRWDVGGARDSGVCCGMVCRGRVCCGMVWCECR